jgi:hypothetical protein
VLETDHLYQGIVEADSLKSVKSSLSMLKSPQRAQTAGLSTLEARQAKVREQAVFEVQM